MLHKLVKFDDGRPSFLGIIPLSEKPPLWTTYGLNNHDFLIC